jgi:hypothetical protein
MKFERNNKQCRITSKFHRVISYAMRQTDSVIGPGPVLRPEHLHDVKVGPFFRVATEVVVVADHVALENHDVPESIDAI